MSTVIFEATDKIGFSLPIELNGSKKRISFAGGIIRDGVLIAARYISTNTDEIAAIKNTASFKKGAIKVFAVHGVDTNLEPIKTSIKYESTDVTNEQTAREYIISVGIPEADIRDLSFNQLILFAKGKGFSFPKWQTFNK